MHKTLVITALILLSLLQTHPARGSENPDQESPEIIRAAAERVRQEFGAVDHLSLPLEEEVKSQNYRHIDPKRWVPSALLKRALSFYTQNKSHFPNADYITIVDLGPRSNEFRLFIVNMITGDVERFRTTHGEGSDVDRDGIAESFGNEPGSKKSSLGFVRTAEEYSGAWGRSLRLDGLSTTNSKIRERAIVFHGWNAVIENNQVQVMSWGCVTSDLRLRDQIIDKIRGGSLMLIDTSI